MFLGEILFISPKSIDRISLVYVHQGDTGKSGHGRGDFAVRDAPLASIFRKEGGGGGRGGGGRKGEGVWKKGLETNFEGIRPLLGFSQFQVQLKKSKAKIG